jgi:hypothetical protein
LLFAVFFAFPNGRIIVGAFDKGQFLKSFLDAIRKQHQDSFFLIQSAEVKQTRVLPKREKGISTAGHQVIGIKNSQRIGLHFAHEALAVVAKKLRIDRVVFHGRSPLGLKL